MSVLVFGRGVPPCAECGAVDVSSETPQGGDICGLAGLDVAGVALTIVLTLAEGVRAALRPCTTDRTLQSVPMNGDFKYVITDYGDIFDSRRGGDEETGRSTSATRT